MSTPTLTTTGYAIREARAEDMPGARRIMLDTFYNVLGCGYMPEHHDDVIHPERVYLDHPNQRLWVAVRDDEVVATTAVQARGPRTPPHPGWLAEQFPDGVTAQLFRVYVAPEHQRRGLASRLVEHAVAFVKANPALDRLYLHTDAKSPGALEFWQTFGTVVHDARRPGARFQTVHLTIPLN
ncbi:GNAT family N-acetyltransferase [Nocardia shimofusensis]|uniref:GNAT family N-acetyltransferase n=1 Tax=Nocardia shimofusensis TaxID=228596 RepID=UPI00082EC121|nr:GNAT family N-acetyltransferase [Nocardia shimofusensis]